MKAVNFALQKNITTNTYSTVTLNSSKVYYHVSTGRELLYIAAPFLLPRKCQSSTSLVRTICVHCKTSTVCFVMVYPDSVPWKRCCQSRHIWRCIFSILEITSLCSWSSCLMITVIFQGILDSPCMNVLSNAQIWITSHIWVLNETNFKDIIPWFCS